MLYDSELIVPTSITGENYTSTPDLVLFIFNNSSKIYKRHKSWMREIRKELKRQIQEKRDHYLYMRVQFVLYTEW
jgi:hypothetical protein